MGSGFSFAKVWVWLGPGEERAAPLPKNNPNHTFAKTISAPCVISPYQVSAWVCHLQRDYASGSIAEKGIHGHIDKET